MSKNLDELQTLFIVNKLSFGIDKTNYMLFSNKRIDKSDIFIKIYQNVMKNIINECKLVIMCKGEVSISDSLLLPPFSNQVVK